MADEPTRDRGASDLERRRILFDIVELADVHGQIARALRHVVDDIPKALAAGDSILDAHLRHLDDVQERARVLWQTHIRPKLITDEGDAS